jgi:hypothetical protein
VPEWNPILHWGWIYTPFRHFKIGRCVTCTYTHCAVDSSTASEQWTQNCVSEKAEFQHLLKYRLPGLVLSFGSNFFAQFMQLSFCDVTNSSLQNSLQWRASMTSQLNEKSQDSLEWLVLKKKNIKQIFCSTFFSEHSRTLPVNLYSFGTYALCLYTSYVWCYFILNKPTLLLHYFLLSPSNHLFVVLLLTMDFIQELISHNTPINQQTNITN